MILYHALRTSKTPLALGRGRTPLLEVIQSSSPRLYKQGTSVLRPVGRSLKSTLW